MKSKEIVYLAAILVIGLAVRLYKIDRPIADWHSWRQADTAAVARNFIKEGYNPFIPKYDDMSSQGTGLDNPNRYRFVEFPIYNSIIYIVWLVTGVNTLSARLVTVFITLGSTALLYLLVRRFSGWQMAALSSFFFATLPFNVFYSSAILPAPFMIFSLLALYLFFSIWVSNQRLVFLIISILLANLAILSWPIAIFFLFPLIYLSFAKYRFSIFKNPNLWAFAICSILPFIGWRIWILNFPEGIPSWRFLLNDANIRFKGAFFRWIIQERLGGLILTAAGFPLFVTGLLKRLTVRENFFYHSWLLSAITFVVVFASGNVRHDYYQVPLVPILSIYLAIGTIALFSLPKNYFIKQLGPLLAVFLIVLTYGFSIFEVRGYYWVNRPQIIEAGMAADRVLPKDAIVIAPYNGDTAFLYQTNRYGYPVYPIVDNSLEKLTDGGIKYFVSVEPNQEFVKTLAQKCKVLDATNNYVIVEVERECLN